MEVVMVRVHRLLVLSLLWTFCLEAATVFAKTPMEEIQATIQQVIAIVDGAASERNEIQRERLRDTLMPRFDWVEMAKQTLGKQWDTLQDRQDEFIAAFAEFLGSSYVGKIGSYKDEKILFLQETVDDNQAQVKTKIVSSKGEPTAVNYRLHRIDGEWKVYDVVVEDISLVVNFRAQFRRILAKGSFDDLLRQMKEKEAKKHN
jgi:phospholipid transport system substrate-binding protein